MSKPPTTLHPLTTLTGTHPLTLGPSTYIHLRAHIITTHAPVTIQGYCIIGEKSVIGLKDPNPTYPAYPSSVVKEVKGEQEEEEGEGGGSGEGRGKVEGGKEGEVEVVELQSHISIAPNAIIQASKIGTGTEVCVGAKIGQGAVVGKYCKIGPFCTVAANEVIPDYTVIYGYNERRIDRSSSSTSGGMEAFRRKAVEQQVEVLRRAEGAARRK